MRQRLRALALLCAWLSPSLVEAYDKECGRIAVLQKEAMQANPSAVPPIAIPIKATIDCIKNITVDFRRTYPTAVMLDQMSLYLDFETTLESLKNPPADWPYPAHDLRARLDEVTTKVKNKQYANEYDFEVELFEKVFAPAHSGHLIFYPDLITNPWYWSRNVPLVSISEDGTSLPKIFFRDDILQNSPNASQLSPLSTIDGVDANKFIEDLVFRAAPHDPDAGYNAMFYNKAYRAARISNGGYFAAEGRTSNIYPGENTTYTFENGTSVTVNNVAFLKNDFAGATDNFYFVNRYHGEGYSSGNPVKLHRDPAGYPTPVIATKDGLLGGYYLEGDGMDDVAVLSVLSFSPGSVVEYQAVAETFLADAVRDGKKKLVVDLSANNGGYILSGYDLFRQLFPHTEQVGLTRFRNNKVVDAAIRVTEKILPPDFDIVTANKEQCIAWEGSWNYRHDLNQNGQQFNSSSEKFSTNIHGETNYSSLLSWDLNDPYLTTKGPVAFGTEITGYGNRTNFTQPFPAEDIIMLTDGFCASTCFLFSDFMKNQGHVKSVVVGGRPTTNPMQAVGGVKGGELSTWIDLWREVYRNQFYLWQTNQSDSDAANIKNLFLTHKEFDFFTATAAMNLRDVIQPDHVDDGLAAQFVHENADCRLFYTKDMIVDVTNTWKKAASVTWQGAKCVVGSLPKRSVSRDTPKEQKPMRWRMDWRNRTSTGLKTKRVTVQEETVEKTAAWRRLHELKAIE